MIVTVVIVGCVSVPPIVRETLLLHRVQSLRSKSGAVNYGLLQFVIKRSVAEREDALFGLQHRVAEAGQSNALVEGAACAGTSSVSGVDDRSESCLAGYRVATGSACFNHCFASFYVLTFYENKYSAQGMKESGRRCMINDELLEMGVMFCGFQEARSNFVQSVMSGM